MNKLLASSFALSLLVGSAHAADLGVITQDAPAGYIASDWTGFYAGIFGGLSTGDTSLSAVAAGVPTVGLFDLTGGGGLLGVQVGANYQMNQFVIGAVADFAVTNHHAGIGGAGLGGATLDFRLNNLATVRARAGYAFDNLLAYVHGGVAFGQLDQDALLGAPVGASNLNRVGYTVGAGLEYALNESISIQAEYAYTDLGDKELFVLPGGSINEAVSFHTIKAGVNFSF